MSTPDTLVDGRPADMIAVNDRGLQYGDGVFETMTCREGQPRWLDRHLRRLQHGCGALGLAFTDEALLRQELIMMAAGSTCILKAIVTRGPSIQRGYRASTTASPTRIVSRHEWPSANPQPLRVAWSAVTLGENPALAGVKHLNRLEQVLAQNAMPPGVDEVLMCSTNGTVVSASAANLFLIGKDMLLTPALDRCGVAGVMRALVLEAASALGLSVAVRPIVPAEVTSAAGLFVTNVRRGPQAIGWLDGRELPTQPLVARLAALIHATA
jgi:4-amino-4-deoxychorismate lyase